MRKIIALLMLLPVAALVRSQTIKLEAGTTVGSLNYGVADIKAYENTSIGYYITMGIDYLKRKKFNLSSNIGLVNKAGYSNVEFSDPLGNSSYTVKSKGAIDFITLNTLAEYSLFDKKLTPFVFGGIRGDYAVAGALVDVGNLSSKFFMGLTGGVGLKYNLDKMLFGVRGACLYDIIKADRIDIQSFLISLQVGYTLK